MKMTETLAVLIVIAFLVSGSNLTTKLQRAESRWRYEILPGILGGLFGIYGNLAGVDVNGAVVSVRDVGPMMAGITGGPMGGIIAGAIAGGHRMFLGGITANACIIATCLIGLICGLVSMRYRERVVDPVHAFILGGLLEIMHLCIVLVMVKPFEAAWEIVAQIFLPFVMINALGFTVLVLTMNTVNKQRKIEAERSRLQSELRVAADIQQSLLPHLTEQFPGRKEISVAASMTAAKDVGGDFYDFFFVDDSHMAVVIADVSGKGVPASLFMVNAKTTLQNCVRDIPDLAEAICKANDSLCRNNEAEMFVTAWIGVLELATGKMRYVNAGHNPPVMITPPAAEYIRARSGLVLAAMEGVPYKEKQFEMKPGDRLFLYTDGVTEAIDKLENQYGEDRLLDCLQAAQKQDCSSVLQRVTEDMESFVKGAEAFDDVTMVCLEYRGPQE